VIEKIYLQKNAKKTNFYFVYFRF